MTFEPSVFDLPSARRDKAAAELIADDERHLAAVGAALAHAAADLAERRAELRRRPGGSGQEGLERDAEIHELSRRLSVLSRFGPDVCIGRMVPAGVGAGGPSGAGAEAEPVYVGRVGLTAPDGRRLLVDWRAPAAEPFFGATPANPMGLSSRRRYRWVQGRIRDYWDEAFDERALASRASLDDQSAFIASLGESRSPRMRDVLGTLQSDQDAIIRAGSRGALVVDGGPGTGKTVVALHRAAYLKYADPRLEEGRGAVLFVGPHRPYLAYVSDVLPDLGEDGVLTCTLADLVPEGAAAAVEADPAVAALKAGTGLLEAIEPAVALYEEPPAEGLLLELEEVEVRLGAAEWAEAFAAPEPGTPHNEAREQVWEALVDIAADQHGAPAGARAALEHHRGLREALHRAWPLLDSAELVSDLLSVPAYLQRCAPGLSDAEIRLLQRPPGSPWTTSDLPLLDAARRRLGDAGAARRRRRLDAEAAAERARMDDVVADLIEHDDSELLVMHMLRGDDLRAGLGAASDRIGPVDRWAGPFAHIVVDEAQELTDAQWRMLLARCPSQSFTIVGDRAQARSGFPESWLDRLHAVGFHDVALAGLSVNYRTPAEIMEPASREILAALPDANVPVSIRRTGTAVRHGRTDELRPLVAGWRAEHPEGTACIIGTRTIADVPGATVLTPELAKGLEFDLVVLVEPEAFGDSLTGAVDRYVAMTRATAQLVLLSAPDQSRAVSAAAGADAPGCARMGRAVG
ncbi:RNA polymerase recycling motor ATPase HelR [Zhihengliuella alba]|uniref:RNA polymerase recycling motor ATPase HelR n=1 Tax=Zhihengliuella alba TaxID=547018 RepID=A0ABP7DBJ2_9MICC